MARLFKVIITRTDRASLPSGAAIGFTTSLNATDLEHARTLAAARLANHQDASLLFIERIEDVTP